MLSWHFDFHCYDGCRWQDNHHSLSDWQDRQMVCHDDLSVVSTSWRYGAMCDSLLTWMCGLGKVSSVIPCIKNE